MKCLMGKVKVDLGGGRDMVEILWFLEATKDTTLWVLTMCEELSNDNTFNVHHYPLVGINVILVFHMGCVLSLHFAERKEEMEIGWKK